jgi:two-component system, NarL family, sensor histidine kinase UhpB
MPRGQAETSLASVTDLSDTDRSERSILAQLIVLVLMVAVPFIGLLFAFIYLSLHRVGFPRNATTSDAYFDLFGIALGVSIGMTVLVLALAIYMARRFVKPIEELRRATSRIASTGSVEEVPAAGPREIVDLTESFNKMVRSRIESQRALLATETLFGSMVEASHEAVWVTDPEGRTTFVNPRMKELIGYEPSEMIDRPYLDFVDELDRVMAEDQRVRVSEGEGGVFVFPLRRKDGRRIICRVSATRIASHGVFAGTIGMLTDISAEHAAEQKLRRSEERLRQAQRDAMLGSWDWNPVTGICHASDEMFSVLGRPVPEDGILTAEAFEWHVHPDDLQRVLSTFFDAVHAQTPIDMRYRIMTFDGKERVVRARGNAVADEENGGFTIAGTTQDITAEENARVDLEEKRAHLRALSDRLIVAQEEERKAVARELHDELGQALTAIKIDLDGLATRRIEEADMPLLDRARKAALETIRAVQRLSSDLRPVVLDDLGLEAALQAEARAFEQRTGIECDVSIRNEDAIPSDEVNLALFRIAQEALTNVARHSHATRVEIRARFDGSDVILEVRDDGEGIQPDALGADASLGLIGMRERAAIVGGSLAIEGYVGRGTIVCARIPVARVEKA